MRLLVTGDREWINREVVYAALATLPSDSTIIHGFARGLDRIAAECALELGLRIDKLPTPGNRLGGYPYLSKLGRAGGPVRNTQMLREGRPDECWAWHQHIWSSHGTKNMVEQALRANVPTYVYTNSGIRYRASLVQGEISLEDWGRPVGRAEIDAANKHLRQMGLDFTLQRQRSDVLDAIREIDAGLSNSDQHIVFQLNLPNHPSTCDCKACDTAYGPRRRGALWADLQSETEAIDGDQIV